MPNQYSADSRRVTYVEDREVFEHLQSLSEKQGVTIGELIRKATLEKYGRTSLDDHEPTDVSRRFAKSAPPVKPAPQRASIPRNKKYGV